MSVEPFNMSARSHPFSAEERLLFSEALDIADPAARSALLDRKCAGQPELRQRVEALLHASLGAETLFSSPWYQANTDGDANGGASRYITRIGRYRLLSRIGEGGCGVVYLATQEGPVQRTVALKVIRLGMDTEEVVKRFEAERQALALMEHPYIARVFDAGAADNGRPFFVMERVDGVRITEYCARQRLPLPERLELFIKVCQGVQHAHEKGVIHRDLKSSNILVAEVDGLPVPKIIDFGIAKATSWRGVERTLHTEESGPLIGSPSHMSPEHAWQGGLELDTRSDVFSLGVLLCELLTGMAPFETCDWRRLEPDEIREKVRTREARRPSAVFGSATEETRREAGEQRGVSPEKLQAQMEGELDWIVLKALAKERDRRYATAVGLAADVRRYLTHDVVEARPPGRLYPWRKFVQRNKGPVIAAALVLASLVVGLGLSLFLFVREQRALEAQVELRRETERARANEAALRQRAEAGERIAKAAVQVSYKRLLEADALVSELPADFVQPSLESAVVFRTLGTWHAQAQRWQQAARYLGAFASSLTEIDASDVDGVSGDLIPASVAIVRSGRLDDYERFRGLLLRRFAETRHTIVAEQVMKSCLLTPASKQTLNGLTPLSEIVAKSCPSARAASGRVHACLAVFLFGTF